MKIILWIISIIIGSIIYINLEHGFVGLVISVLSIVLIQTLMKKVFFRKLYTNSVAGMMKANNLFADKVFASTAKEFVDSFFEMYSEIKDTKKFKSDTDLHLNVLYENPDEIKEATFRDNLEKCCSTIEGTCYFGVLYLRSDTKSLSKFRARQLIEYIDNELYKRDIPRQPISQKEEILKTLGLDTVEI